MTIGHLGQQTTQGIEQIAVSPRVQVCRSEGARRMRGKDEAHAALTRNVAQIAFDALRYIDNFVFLPCSDSKRFHNVRYPSLFANMLFSSVIAIILYVGATLVVARVPGPTAGDHKGTPLRRPSNDADPGYFHTTDQL